LLPNRYSEHAAWCLPVTLQRAPSYFNHPKGHGVLAFEEFPGGTGVMPQKRVRIKIACQKDKNLLFLL
jgi:hypothetical protein